jgi:hypothetical protein
VDLNLEQYEAFREARNASADNIKAQDAIFRKGNLIVGQDPQLNLLLAITDWANAVSSEAQSLTGYNTELANLELQTGTILETHGVRFTEEQFNSIGPHGRCFEDECYPKDLRPTQNSQRYEAGSEAAENTFDLDDFAPNREGTE